MKKTIIFIFTFITAFLIIGSQVNASDLTITLDNGQWNNAVNSEHVKFLNGWLTQHDVTTDELKTLVEKSMNYVLQQTKDDGVVSADFNWGTVDSFSQWEGVLKLEIKGGDQRGDVHGRKHAMLVISSSSLKEDGTVEVFAMLNEVFALWASKDAFNGVGYPIEKPLVINEVVHQNFSKGYVNETKYVEGKHIGNDGVEYDLGEVPVEEDLTGILDTSHDGKALSEIPAYGWVLEIGAEAIEQEVKRVYQELKDLGFDYGKPHEPVRLWSAAGDGSGGAEETKWLRQEFTGGDHTAYLWNRVHGYIFVNQNGEGYAVFNDILLEWHGGWSDKGGPTSQPIYVTVEVDGEQVTDVYQNFANVYIVVPSSDRALAQIISSESITAAEALEQTKERYNLVEETPKPEEPNKEDDKKPEEKKNNAMLIIILSSVGVLLVGGAVTFFLVKRKQ